MAEETAVIDDDESMDMLTDEERASLDNDVEPEQEEKEPDTAEQEEAPIEEEPEQEEEKAPEPEPEQKEDPEPEPEAEPQETREERIAAIREEMAGLGDKLEDGDIDFKQYNEINNKLAEEREDIKTSIREDVRNQEAAQATQQASWQDATDQFLAVKGNEVVNTNPVIQDAFMGAYKRVSATPEAQGKSYFDIMNMAKGSLVDAGFSFGKTEQAPEKKEVNTKPRQDNAEIPQTLGDVSASKANDNSEFAYLDKLDGIALEDALAGMSSDKASRYMEA